MDILRGFNLSLIPVVGTQKIERQFSEISEGRDIELKNIMGFNKQEGLKKRKQYCKQKPTTEERIYKVGVHTHTHTNVCYPRYIEYSLRRRALNTDVPAKLWPHKYLFNAEWNLVQGSHSNYKHYSFGSCSTALKTRLYNFNKNQNILNNLNSFSSLVRET